MPLRPSPAPRASARVASFTWTPASRELRSCAALPPLLELEAHDERPLLARVLERLAGDDVDRLHGAVRTARASGDPQSVEVRIRLPGGAVRHLTATTVQAPDSGGDSVVGVVHDVTRARHVERALDARHAVTAALAHWGTLGFDGLLGPLGAALSADEVIVWVPRSRGLRRVATWRPSGDGPPGETEVPEAVVRAWQLGLPIAATADGHQAHLAVHPPPTAYRQLAFPVLTLNGTLAVVDLRGADGLWVSDTLTRLLAAVGRELGAFFATRPCRVDAFALSGREMEILELAAEGLSAPDIATRLVLSPATVRSHLRNIYAKLEVGERVSAVVKAMRAGILD